MAFDFYQEIHSTRTFFQKWQQADSLDTGCRPLDQQSSNFPTFGSIFVQIGYFWRTRNHIQVIALYRYVGLGRLKRCCIYRHRCFEHSLHGETIKSFCSNWCHGCERLYFEQYNLGSFTLVRSLSGKNWQDRYKADKVSISFPATPKSNWNVFGV